MRDTSDEAYQRYSSVLAGEIGAALIKTGRIAEALEMLGIQTLDTYITTITDWIPAFEQIQLGLALKALYEIARIGAWIQPSLSGLSVLLSEPPLGKLPSLIAYIINSKSFNPITHKEFWG